MRTPAVNPTSTLPRRPSADAGSPGPRRSLRIVHTVSSLLGGGMEHFVVRLASAQHERGHRVTILALRGGPLRERAERLGLRVAVPGGPGRVGRVLRTALLMARLRPDIVHAHNPTSLHYAVLGKLTGRPRVLMTDHSQAQRVPTAAERRRLDLVVAVSGETARQRDPGGHPERVIVIHNGVDPPSPCRDRDAVRGELGLGDRPAGLMLAAMRPAKGHPFLLRALDLLRRDGVAVTVLIVGDGPDGDAVRRRAEELGLGPEWARFLGFRADAPDLLEAADFLVLPSLMEGLPMAILEAMSHALPVVATPVGGVGELIVDGEHGLLVPPGDPEALASAIARMATDPALRASLGASGRRRVETDFSFESMTRKYENSYFDLLAGR